MTTDNQYKNTSAVASVCNRTFSGHAAADVRIRFAAMSVSQFKDLPGYPGYQMSDDGRAWKVKNGLRIELKAVPNVFRKGYMQIAPYVNGKNKTIAVHRAMALTFIGERPDGMEVAHIDGNKSNNAIVNLAYVTPKENNGHKQQHGTQSCGARCHSAKLTQSKVDEIRALYADGNHSQSQLARMFGVTQTPISLLIRNKTWVNA